MLFVERVEEGLDFLPLIPGLRFYALPVLLWIAIPLSAVCQIEGLFQFPIHVFEPPPVFLDERLFSVVHPFARRRLGVELWTGKGSFLNNFNFPRIRMWMLNVESVQAAIFSIFSGVAFVLLRTLFERSHRLANVRNPA